VAFALKEVIHKCGAVYLDILWRD